MIVDLQNHMSVFDINQALIYILVCMIFSVDWTLAHSPLCEYKRCLPELLNNTGETLLQVSAHIFKSN